MDSAEDTAWYYDLKQHRAVQGKQVWVDDRLGPYPDKETAERALEIVQERNRQADQEDD